MNQDRSLAKAHIGSALILEDEPLVAMVMEDLVRELGATRIDVCIDLASALKASSAESYDCAILDVFIDGRMSSAVADRLEARGIPFIFSSGSGEAALEPRHRHIPMLGKPFADDDLKARLLCAVTSSKPQPIGMSTAAEELETR